MSREGEAYMPSEMVQRVLESASGDVVLVGGQALAYWMDYYGVHEPTHAGPAISRDVDFFTPDAANAGPLRKFARAIGGRMEVQAAEAVTALIGSAVAPAGENRVYNVDLLHSVVGLTRESVEANAVRVAVPGSRVELRVMHPLDVLQSRNANLHTLADKQDEMGRLQYRLAIEVARKYLEETFDGIARNPKAKPDQRRRAMFDAIQVVSEYSSEDAARKNAERYGLFLADAIPAWRIESPVFWQKQWPHLRSRMSPDYARQCELRAGRAVAPGP